MARRSRSADASCSIKTIAGALEALRLQGKPIEAALEAAGVNEADLDDPDGRLPAAAAIRAWGAAHRVSGDPAFGLRAAEAISPDTTALFAYLAASSATSRDAFERATRYVRIMSDALEYRLEVKEDRTVCSIHLAEGGTLAPVYADYVVGMMARLAGQVVADAEELEAWFEQAEPAHAAEYARVIPLPVRFGAPRNGIAGGLAKIDDPLPGADPTLRKLLEQQAEQALARLPERGSFADGVRRAIARGLPQGQSGVDAVAAALGLSARTLRRRLDEEGLTHRLLVDEVRCQLAREALADSRSVNEVAFLVGFSDASAFHKAFRRWTGKSPREFVRSL